MTDFIDFTRLERPGSPNTFLLLPQGFPSTAKPDAASPEFPVGASRLFDALMQSVREAGVDGTLQADLPSRRLRYVAVTKLLRFKDDVDAAVIDTGPETSALAIYSRSRIGYSDLGANRKRVEGLLKAVQADIRT